MHQNHDLIQALLTRAEIRRRIRGAQDRIADQCEAAAITLQTNYDVLAAKAARIKALELELALLKEKFKDGN